MYEHVAAAPAYNNQKLTVIQSIESSNSTLTDQPAQRSVSRLNMSLHEAPVVARLFE